MLQAIETHYEGFRFRSRLEARWAVFFDTLNVRFQYEPEGFQLEWVKRQNDWQIDYYRYLPDFYLPDLEGGSYVEIKMNDLSADEIAKAGLLAYHSDKSVTMFIGDVGQHQLRSFISAGPPPIILEVVGEALLTKRERDAKALLDFMLENERYHWNFVVKTADDMLQKLYSHSYNQTWRLYKVQQNLPWKEKPDKRFLCCCPVCDTLLVGNHVDLSDWDQDPSSDGYICSCTNCHHGYSTTNSEDPELLRFTQHPKLLAAYKAARSARFEFGESG